MSKICVASQSVKQTFQYCDSLIALTRGCVKWTQIKLYRERLCNLKVFFPWSQFSEYRNLFHCCNCVNKMSWLVTDTNTTAGSVDFSLKKYLHWHSQHQMLEILAVEAYTNVKPMRSLFLNTVYGLWFSRCIYSHKSWNAHFYEKLARDVLVRFQVDTRLATSVVNHFLVSYGLQDLPSARSSRVITKLQREPHILYKLPYLSFMLSVYFQI